MYLKPRSENGIKKPAVKHWNGRIKSERPAGFSRIRTLVSLTTGIIGGIFVTAAGKYKW